MKASKNVKVSVFPWSVGAIAIVALTGCSQRIKLRGSECRQNAGAITRAQQAYWLKNRKFAIALSQLGLGISETNNRCRYLLTATKTAAFIRVIPHSATREGVAHCFLGACLPPQSVPTTSYAAGVFTSNAPQPNKLFSVLCYADVGSVELSLPSLQNNQPICPANTKTVPFSSTPIAP
ncbi:type IV pilin-like G/H family protein [Oscillatoria sp. FACHB-1406]|uniref:type IV pilin-like G/H family protein n=1 Tax=Oscillatoria sp. FACHB-1406 TaxID=2692846 RepID=UPI00168309A1|nr:type IV pilin-like G/H family protein [Oscillatoria sp. FACHB-1406]MBD2577142.1 hypothetical protein [Oscillatoria sp. FACHB-1406]